MSDTTPVQLEIYRLFAETDVLSQLVPQCTDLLNSQLAPAQFSISLNLADYVILPSKSPQRFNNERSFGKEGFFTGSISSDNSLDNSQEIDLAVRLLSQRAILESEKIQAVFNTTARILGITFHDVRNTLGSISGIAQLMELDAGDNEELLKSIQDVISIVNRFDHESTNMMKLLRGQEVLYKKNSFNLSDICNQIIKRNSRVYQLSSIDVEAKIQDDISMNGDEELVREIFTEMLVNAASALEESGGKMQVSVAKENENVIISVEHNGSSINNDLQEYIFIPFFTTKEKGRGLGLSKINRYLSDWGGSIKYSTSSESPVKFVVQLPITL